MTIEIPLWLLDYWYYPVALVYWMLSSMVTYRIAFKAIRKEEALKVSHQQASILSIVGPIAGPTMLIGFCLMYLITKPWAKLMSYSVPRKERYSDV